MQHKSDTALNGRLCVNWSFLTPGSCFSLRGPHHHHRGLCPAGGNTDFVPCILSHNQLSLIIVLALSSDDFHHDSSHMYDFYPLDDINKLSCCAAT